MNTVNVYAGTTGIVIVVLASTARAQDIRPDVPPQGVIARPPTPNVDQLRRESVEGVIARPQPNATRQESGPREFPQSLRKGLEDKKKEIARIDSPWREYADQQWHVCDARLEIYFQAYQKHRESVLNGSNVQNDPDATGPSDPHASFVNYQQAVAELKRRIADGLVNSRAQRKLRRDLEDYLDERSKENVPKNPGLRQLSPIANGRNSKLVAPGGTPQPKISKTPSLNAKINTVLDTTMKSIRTYEAAKKAFTSTRSRDKHAVRKRKRAADRIERELQRLTAELATLRGELERARNGQKP